jgi:hypothetical protein
MKRRRSFIIGWIALCLVLTVPFSVAAAPEIGKVAKLRGTAHIVRKAVDRPIAVSVGMPVYLNDEVRTAARSSLRIKLEDGSILTLGPKGHLQLNHFEFEPDEEKRSALFDMFRGKLRVFAKDHETFKKKDFKIKTPTAICGVRGTLFLVWVLSDEVTKVFAFKQEVAVANVFSPGEVIVLVPNYGTDVVLRNAPTQPVFTSPDQQQDAVKDLGQMQGTENPVGGNVRPTPRVPVSGRGYAPSGHPAFGGDVSREGSVTEPGGVPGTPDTDVSAGGQPVAPAGVQGPDIGGPDEPGLPSPPSPPPQAN